MLNYKNTNYITGIVLIILGLDLIFKFINLPFVLVLLAIISVYTIILAYGSIFISSDFYIKAFCNKITDKKEIALSFDDGPVEITNRILDILSERHIEAAFFCIGDRIEKNKEIIKRIDLEGHLIGNHSNSHHFWFDLFTTDRITNELQQTEDSIFKITGKRVRMFRPPYGVTNPRISKAVDKMNYITIGWSLRSYDTTKKDKDAILNKMKKKLKNGDIILFHDTSNDIIYLVNSFIDFLLQNNYKILRLDKLINQKPYENLFAI